MISQSERAHARGGAARGGAVVALLLVVCHGPVSAGLLVDEIAAYPALREAAFSSVPQENAEAVAADADVVARFQGTEGWGKEPRDAAAEQQAVQMMKEGKLLSVAVTPLLWHSSSRVRWDAIRHLGESRDAVAAQLLTQHLAALTAPEFVGQHGDKAAGDVGYVVEALGKLGCRGAGPQVYQALEWAYQSEIRRVPGQCVEALGRLRYAPAASAMAKMLAAGTDLGRRGSVDERRLVAAFNAVTTADIVFHSPIGMMEAMNVGHMGLTHPYTNDLFERRAEAVRQTARECQAVLEGAPVGPREQWLKQQLWQRGVALPRSVGDDPGRIVQAMAQTYIGMSPAARDASVEAQAILVGFVKYGHPLAVPALIDIMEMTQGGEANDLAACLEAIKVNAGDVGLSAVGPPRVSSSAGLSFFRPPGGTEGVHARWTEWWQKNKSLLVYKYESLGN